MAAWKVCLRSKQEMRAVFSHATQRPALGGPAPAIAKGAEQGEVIARATLTKLEGLPDSRLRTFALANLRRSPSEFHAVSEQADRRGESTTAGLIVLYGEASRDGSCGNPRYAPPGIFE